MTCHLNTGASNAARAALDALKALPNSGHLMICTSTDPLDPDGTVPSGAAVLADFTFSATAFGSDTTAGSFPSKTETATASFVQSTVVAGQTGTADSFCITDSGKTKMYFTGSVGTSAHDINLNSVSISSGANVTLSSFTLTQPC